ncbi:S41 family peptidase [Aquisphaera giovannonii]|nr:S41 family peptidase [Aquisphaera giovannonii]
MQRSAVILLLGLLCSRAAAQEAIPSAKLLEDADVLRRIYERAHPGLYRYNTKAQMAGHLAALRAEFARDRSLGEAYVAVSQFLAKVRCGHSYANFYNQPRGVADALFSGRNRVPFLFRWIDGRMIVDRDFSGALKPGTEVLAIEGHPVAEILGKLMTIARADGGNDAKRVAYLEVRGKDRYEAFDIFLPLFYPGIGERIGLEVVPPGAKGPLTLAVAAHDRAQREALGKEAQQPAGADPWKFETLEGGAAYLRMPGWALYDSKWDWKGFLDRGMDALIDRRAPALIVDLRDNEGGLDVGNVLIERITAREVRGGIQRRYTRYRTLPGDLVPFLDTWDWSFKDWGDKAVPDRAGFYRLTRYDDDANGDVIAPRGRRFEGRLVVLVNAANSSATFQFARLIKDNQLGTLVGQPTGGNRRGINGGAFFFAKLPNSKIEFDVPLIATFPGERPLPDGVVLPFLDVPDAGVEPDVPVKPRAEDIAAGVDAELEAARALLKGRR